MESPTSVFHELPELLPTDHQILLSIASEEQRKPEGSVLISQGTENPGLLLLKEGTVSIRFSERGHSRELAKQDGPEVFGEMSLLTGNRANADVIACSDVRVVCLSVSSLKTMFSAHPGLMTRLYKSLVRKVVERLSQNKTDLHSSQNAALMEEMKETWAKSLIEIQNIGFTPLVHEYVKRYEEVGDRDDFLWRWAIRGLELTQLSMVPVERASELGETKLLAVILNVLLDDLADNRGSEELLEMALSLLWSSHEELPATVPEEERAYMQLIVDLWRLICSRCASLPGWEDYRMLFHFDYRQVFSAMRYGLLLHHHPALLNPSEHELYPPHNMNMMVFGSIDLMSVAEFPTNELGSLREVLWKAQSMGQLSNMIVTWEREVPDRDFSSRIFALALSQVLFQPSELQTLAPEVIISRIREAGIEELLFSQWLQLSESILTFAPRLPSIDLHQLLEGLQVLLGMTLASRYRL